MHGANAKDDHYQAQCDSTDATDPIRVIGETAALAHKILSASTAQPNALADSLLNQLLSLLEEYKTLHKRADALEARLKAMDEASDLLRSGLRFYASRTHLRGNSFSDDEVEQGTHAHRILKVTT